MATKRITGLSATTTINATDVLHIGQTSADKKITAPNFKTYILGGSTIGGTDASDIVTNAGTQEMINKTLSDCIIDGGDIDGAVCEDCLLVDCTVNSGAALTVDSDDINRVCSTTATTAQLNHVVGVSSNIQTQLNSKHTKLTVLDIYPLYYYTTAATGAGTTILISLATIKTYFGLSASYYIPLASVTANIAVYTTSLATPVYPTITYNASGAALTSIRFSDLSVSTTYAITITCVCNTTT